MQKILQVKIEKISSDAKGIAKADGKVIFVENALPEDIVKIEITKENKNFSTAKIIEIVEPSPYRVKPFCPLYNACGACSLQHATYEYQLKLKKQIVEDAMRGLNLTIDDVVPSPKEKAFRCKIQYPVNQTKVSKRILAGYYKPKSHELVNIKFCPIQPAICDEIIEFIRQKAQELNISCYDEKTFKGLLKHIVLRYSEYNNDILVTLVVNDDTVFHSIKRLAHEIFDNFEQVKGVCINFNISKSNLILSDKSICICGEEYIEEKILDKVFKIGSNTFFQVNPKSAENIFKYVKEIISSKYKSPIILDAYAGIASFGIVVSDIAKKVISVEENKNSTNLAQEVLNKNKIDNVEVINADTGKFLETYNDKFDVIILDPPRKGCDKKTLDAVLKLTKGLVVYVSCNPATLARDLKYLCENGAKVESIKPFDMFCHTSHIENVAIINFNF